MVVPKKSISDIQSKELKGPSLTTNIPLQNESLKKH